MAKKGLQLNPKVTVPTAAPDVFYLEEEDYVDKLWTSLKQAYAKAIVTTKSSSEMRRVNETTRAKCYSILQLCKAEGGTSVQAEIRQFVQSSFR